MDRNQIKKEALQKLDEALILISNLRADRDTQELAQAGYRVTEATAWVQIDEQLN